MNKRTVFLLDEDSTGQSSICHVLEDEQIEVCSFQAARELLDSYDEEVPGCLVLDLKLSMLDGITVANQIAAQGYCPPYIMMSGRVRPFEVVRAIKSGAMDFIEKPFQHDLLVNRVCCALEEDKRRRWRHSIRNSVRKRIDSLSPREHQVLSLVMSGRLSKQIASQLEISVKTVEAHRAKIVRKMHAESFIHVARLVTAEQTWNDNAHASLMGLPSMNLKRGDQSNIELAVRSD
ncbi:response regulator transcription factor [Neorhodopirellula lusitana]|uniref:response regulator transcription factor n=1 Tax=Neorhodopirellula lusitana TaxID=445327 RepID=UPI00384EAD68